MITFRHKEIKHALLEGAEIQAYSEADEKWLTKHSDNVLVGEYDDCRLRVKPDCSYAMQKIQQLGGTTALDVYKRYINGERAEWHRSSKWFEFLDKQDPFRDFVTVLENKREVRIKSLENSSQVNFALEELKKAVAEFNPTKEEAQEIFKKVESILDSHTKKFSGVKAKNEQIIKWGWTYGE